MRPRGHIDPLLGAAAALGSACAWAVGAMLFRRIGESASPSAMNLAKSVLGLGLLGVVLLAVGVTPVSWASLAQLGVSGLLGIAVGDTLFFAALVRLDPRATLLLATVGHVFTAILAVIVLGEAPGPGVWLGVALVVTGVTAALWGEGAGERGAAWRVGLVCGVASAMAMSLGLVLAKEALHEVPTLQATWIRLAAGLGGVALWSALSGSLRADLRALGDPSLLRSIAVAVAVVMFGGFWLSLFALAKTWTIVATSLGATEPLFVIPLAWALRGERPGVAAVAGALVAVAGAALVLAGA